MAVSTGGNESITVGPGGRRVRPAGWPRGEDLWRLAVDRSPPHASVTLRRLAKNTDIAAGGAMLGFPVTMMLQVALG